MVDMVRVSRRADPYGKAELVNGWVNSKQLTVHKKNLDMPSSKVIPTHYLERQASEREGVGWGWGNATIVMCLCSNPFTFVMD